MNDKTRNPNNDVQPIEINTQKTNPPTNAELAQRSAQLFATNKRQQSSAVRRYWQKQTFNEARERFALPVGKSDELSSTSLDKDSESVALQTRTLRVK